MMKKLLNNPLVVALLALLAVGVVYVQVVEPILNSPNQLATIAVEYAVLGNPQAPESNVTSAPNFGWSKSMFSHNPFSDIDEPVKKQRIGIKHKVKDTTHQLSAVLIGAKQPMAWIDGSLVGMGDAVAGMRVVAIEQDRVVLSSSKGQRILKLQTGSRRNTP